jgi:hypothetical protein
MPQNFCVDPPEISLNFSKPHTSQAETASIPNCRAILGAEFCLEDECLQIIRGGNVLKTPLDFWLYICGHDFFLVAVFLGPVLTKPLAPIVIQRGKCWLPHLVLHSSGPIKKIHSHDCGKCIYFPAHQVAVLSFPLLWSPAKNHSSRSGANPVPSKLEAKQHMLNFICINRKMWDSNFRAFKLYQKKSVSHSGFQTQSFCLEVIRHGLYP